VKQTIAELDVVEVVSDMPGGLVGGARGTVVALHGDMCTVEFLDPEGYTVGLFEIPAGNLEVVWRYESRTFVARED
jgi:hypothetical protein